MNRTTKLSHRLSKNGVKFGIDDKMKEDKILPKTSLEYFSTLYPKLGFMKSKEKRMYI